MCKLFSPAQSGVKTHITTNLTTAELKTYVGDEYDRLTDRLKYYNMLVFKGDSRR